MQKIKITQKDFDDMYEIDTEDLPGTKAVKDDETPKDVEDSILTEEEQTIDDQFFDSLKVEDEI